MTDETGQRVLCEPVAPPRGELEHIHYFCGNTEVPTDLQERQPQRTQLYKGVVALVRAYANIADELDAAGYDESQVAGIKKQLDHYLKAREVVRMASGETLDLKAYEADMRHLSTPTSRRTSRGSSPRSTGWGCST